MYKDKYYKYKSKYLNLKNIQIGSSEADGSNVCSIEPNDTVLFGNGGSMAIVILKTNGDVYKLFMRYTNLINSDKKIKNDSDDNLQLIKNEISIYKLLTENIVETGISGHYVGYLNDIECQNIDEIFKRCPDKYLDFLTMEKTNYNSICSRKYDGYPNFKINENYWMIRMEYCNFSAADFIKEISQCSTFDIELYLDIFLFQIIYTILATKSVYPFFQHNDLFLRNILGKREKNSGNYYTYFYNGTKYKIPQKVFYPKINDFGLSNLDKNHHVTKLSKDNVKDIYNLIYDIYNGGNLGSTSLTVLFQNDPIKLEFIKKYFSNFFNVAQVDYLRSKEPIEMNWNWHILKDADVNNMIAMKTPNELMDVYFRRIFADKSNKVVAVYQSN